MTWWFWVWITVISVWFFISMRRISKVSAYRSHILNKVGVLARKDIAEEKPWEWRHIALTGDDPLIDRMMHRFWRKVDSFGYGDKALLPEEPVDKELSDTTIEDILRRKGDED